MFLVLRAQEIPNLIAICLKKISYLNKTTYEKLNYFKKAFLTILKKNKTPFREIKIKKFDEET